MNSEMVSHLLRLVKSVDQKICERQRFTICELLCTFSQISRTLLYEIIKFRLGYHKVCAKCVLKMPMDVHKRQRMALALTL
jgi:hypothetical protein